jgi:hypothetical protein
MNERIKSLIERAEYQAQKHSGSDWQVHVEPSREQIFEKFAELIVRECLACARGAGLADEVTASTLKAYSHKKAPCGAFIFTLGLQTS